MSSDYGRPGLRARREPPSHFVRVVETGGVYSGLRIARKIFRPATEPIELHRTRLGALRGCVYAEPIKSSLEPKAGDSDAFGASLGVRPGVEVFSKRFVRRKDMYRTDIWTAWARF